MKKSLILICSSLCLLLSACNNSQGSNGDDNNPPTPVDDNTEQFVVDFGTFEFSGNSKEVSTTSSTFNEQVKSFVNTKIGGEYVSEVSSASYVGLKKISFNEKTGLDGFNTLQLSSGSAAGSISLTFSKKLVSVTLDCQAYYNAFMRTWELEEGEDPYVCYSIDLDTTFKVNEELWTLPSVTHDESNQSYVMPQKETKTFSVNANTLTIEDDENLGRAFIHKMTLSFEK